RSPQRAPFTRRQLTTVEKGRRETGLGDRPPRLGSGHRRAWGTASARDGRCDEEVPSSGWPTSVLGRPGSRGRALEGEAGAPAPRVAFVYPTSRADLVAQIERGVAPDTTLLRQNHMHPLANLFPLVTRLARGPSAVVVNFGLCLIYARSSPR